MADFSKNDSISVKHHHTSKPHTKHFAIKKEPLLIMRNGSYSFYHPCFFLYSMALL